MKVRGDSGEEQASERAVGRCGRSGASFGVVCSHVSYERTAEIRALLARLADLDEKLVVANTQRRTVWRSFERSDALTFAVN